ncbi:MAG: aminotransferase class III-fold pyridoxal phosphate-dependent enzyme, partial [Myxococcales bacterium]|nr:aminotransferase class III-fold pyridoxal phosphate-dependent enzyme [Myxococcales bacterium]
PVPGFLQGLREECTRVGALLIFDEVITGFRLGIGGAQQMFGVTPDLTCMGKVIGGGLNVGAFGGRADVMDHLAPLGPVYQAGTLSGNPLATAAGLAALSLLDRTAYERLERAAARLAAGLQDAFDSAGVAARASRVGTLVGLFIANPDAAGPVEAPRDYDGARTVA